MINTSEPPDQHGCSSKHLDCFYTKCRCDGNNSTYLFAIHGNRISCGNFPTQRGDASDNSDIAIFTAMVMTLVMTLVMWGLAERKMLKTAKMLNTALAKMIQDVSCLGIHSWLFGPVCPWCCPLWLDWQRWVAEAQLFLGSPSGSFQGRLLRCLIFEGFLMVFVRIFMIFDVNFSNLARLKSCCLACPLQPHLPRREACACQSTRGWFSLAPSDLWHISLDFLRCRYM